MRAFLPATAAVLLGFSLACGGSSESSGSDYIDLDGVFDAFETTLSQLDVATGNADEEIVVEETEMEADAGVDAAFLAQFASNLNADPMKTSYGTPMGTAFTDEGAVKGFDDPNMNMTQDTGEADVFLLELDLERERVLITDLQHSEYTREGRVRPRVAGLATGYLLGRMLGGQRAAGVNTAKYASKSVSSKGYHKSVSGAKRYTSSSSSSSARSRGGSRSSSGGK